MRTIFLIIMLIFFMPYTIFGNNKVVYRSFFNFNGVEYESIVTNSMFKKTPTWESNNKCTPLAPRRAMEISIKYLNKRFPNVDHWFLDKISLVPLDGRTNLWIYIIQMTPLPEDGALSGRSFPVKLVILMNGKVVDFKKTTGASKVRP